MSSNQALFALRDVLADLYPYEDDGRRVADEAGLRSSQITFSAQAVRNWMAILTYALNQESVDSVVAIGLKEYPNNSHLAAAWSAYQLAESSAGPVVPSAAASKPLPDFERKHLTNELQEQQARYDTATKFIQLLDKDIAQTLDLDRRYVLEQKRADRVTDRNAAQAEITRLQARLNG